MPTFKPLRAEQTTGLAPIWRETTLEEDGDGYILKTPYHITFPEGTEVSRDFTLPDLVPYECVVAGHTTRGAWEMGVYYGCSSGRYLNFNGSQEGSLLWGNLCLVRGPPADALLTQEKAKRRFFEKVQAKLEEMKARGEDTDNCGTPDVSDDEDGAFSRPPLKRTDSGAGYGFTGYPDVEFWARSGIVADAFVPAVTYRGHEDDMDQEFYVEGIRQLRNMNHDGISPAMQAAINKQAGHYTRMLEEMSS
jgi:hypothetical protein